MSNTSAQKKWFIASILFTLLAIGTHFYLSSEHYSLKLGLAAEKSFCNINQTFNCDAVAASSYSVLFGIPIAVLGAITHVVLLILLGTAFMSLSTDNSRIKRYALYLASFTALVSIVMGVISSGIVKSYCLFCMAAYLLSFLNFAAILKIQDGPAFSHLGADIKALFTQAKWVLALFIVIPAAGYIGNSVILDGHGYRQINLAIADSISSWENSPQQNFNQETGLVYYKGQGEPKMTIVEFADFRCIHCKMAYPPLHAFTDSRPDVKLIYKPFPLDGKCNQSMQRQGDGLTCKLSALALCAEKVLQRGWDVHHWIFDHQQTFSSAAEFPNYLTKVGMDLKLDSASLQSCIDSDETQAELIAAAKEGADAKIMGTPSIFVNGKQLNRGQSLIILDAVYKKLKQ